MAANFDLGYDSARYNEGDTSSLGIYSSYANNFDDTELSIQTLSGASSDSTVVPLGLVTNAGASQTISATSTLNNTFVYLEDREKGTWHNLNETDYTFSTPNAMSGTGRFYIHVQSNALNTVASHKENLVLTTTNNTVNIHGNRNAKLNVTVLDIKGTVVYKNILGSNENSLTLNRPTGIYIVKLENQNIQDTHKVILK